MPARSQKGIRSFPPHLAVRRSSRLALFRPRAAPPCCTLLRRCPFQSIPTLLYASLPSTMPDPSPTPLCPLAATRLQPFRPCPCPTLLYASLPSTMPVSGLQNQSRNWSWLANSPGMRKCMSDHSSIRSFCSGVPVWVVCVCIKESGMGWVRSRLARDSRRQAANEAQSGCSASACLWCKGERHRGRAEGLVHADDGLGRDKRGNFSVQRCEPTESIMGVVHAATNHMMVIARACDEQPTYQHCWYT